MGAEGLRGAIAILIASTGIGLAVGSANAETTAVAELEASDTADFGVHDTLSAAQRAELIREKRELQLQRQAKALANARVVLFEGIDLSAEQSRGVDAIIEAEREYGRRTGELRFQLATAQKQGDAERARAIRQESGPLRARRKGPDECMEEMRAFLSEEQRTIFDMNRARLAAEKQQSQKGRHKRRRQAGAEVEAE